MLEVLDPSILTIRLLPELILMNPIPLREVNATCSDENRLYLACHSVKNGYITIT